MLKGKTVLLGITGGIACYKAAELTSLLIKQHADVHVIMTEGALKFMTPLTFEALTGNKVHTDVFDKDSGTEIPHISLSGKADVLIIAPATADIAAKLAHGIADDMLTSTALACCCEKIIAPAMNTRMYENKVTQDNINTLSHYGWKVISPDSGRLACGDTGKGKLPSPEVLLKSVFHAAANKDMAGLRVLITAGATKEAIDPVRYITNHSTGKMGYALAECAARRGAEVTLISGSDKLSDPPFINTVHTVSAKDMLLKVKEHSENADIIIKAAAVADYRPKFVSDEKIKKSDSEAVIELERTDDILKHLGENKKDGQFLCGFSMETENLLENSKKKLQKKNLDMICANNLKVKGAGFATDTNVITLITKDNVTELPIMSKAEAADVILSEILNGR